ncbi:MAG: hypothetical protein GX596_06850 [Propionibacterium sp.]|nr:hypothetical protein [Propionibacterium sp.]
MRNNSVRAGLVGTLAVVMSACSSSGSLHTFQIPDSHTDLGHQVSLSRSDDGCIEAALSDGAVVPAAFPEGTTADGSGVTLPDGREIPFDAETTVGGVLTDIDHATSEMALSVQAECEAGDPYFLLW